MCLAQVDFSHFGTPREFSHPQPPTLLTPTFTIVLDTVHRPAPPAGAVAFSTEVRSSVHPIFGSSGAFRSFSTRARQGEGKMCAFHFPGLKILGYHQSSFGLDLVRLGCFCFSAGTENRNLGTGFLRIEGFLRLVPRSLYPITRCGNHIFRAQYPEKKRSLDVFRFKFLPLSLSAGKFPQNIANKDLNK